MTQDQLTGRYDRLRAELAAVYAEPVLRRGRIDRLDRITSELAAIERTLAAQRPAARLVSVQRSAL